MIATSPMNAFHPLPVSAGTLPPAPARGALPRGPIALYAAWSIALVAGYVAIDAASYLFWVDPIPVKPWNPQAGLAVAFVYAGGLPYAWPVLIAAWLAEVLLRAPAEPLHAQWAAAVAVTLPATLTGLALRTRMRVRDLVGVRAIRDFLLIGAVGAALSAACYVLAYMATHRPEVAPLYSSMLHKWLGDMTGLVVVAPLTMLAMSPESVPRRPMEPLWLDLGAFVIALAAVVYLLFGGNPDAGERPLYLLFVPLIVLAMRRGLPGAVLGVATVQVTIVVALWLAGRNVQDAVTWQMLMLVLGVTTLVLGAVSGERRRALVELARRSAELNAQQQALHDAMRFSTASETAATLAHELSQPLSAIGTYARAGLEMLKRGTGKPGDIASVMERIAAESARTRESVQRIRDFFRTGVLRREPVALGAVISDAADALRDGLQAQAIALSIDAPATLPPLSADPVQLRTVLHNLIGNAADASAAAPPPRWVRIAMRERDGFVEVDIADSGHGIDPVVRDKLFEPLATTKPAGMGLGLPISRTLIHAHGGRLELAAVHPTTFRFTLPIHGNAAS
jgi:signal transduction histidine kinase